MWLFGASPKAMGMLGTRKWFRHRLALSCLPADKKTRHIKRYLKLKRASVDATERRDPRVGEGFPEEVIFELGLKEEQEFPSVDREGQKYHCGAGVAKA